MADHPDAPTTLVDVAMTSPGARALLHRLGGQHEYSNLRTDLSDVVAAVLAAVPAPRGPITLPAARVRT